MTDISSDPAKANPPKRAVIDFDAERKSRTDPITYAIGELHKIAAECEDIGRRAQRTRPADVARRSFDPIAALDQRVTRLEAAARARAAVKREGGAL